MTSTLHIIYRIESAVSPEVWAAYKDDPEYARRIMEICEYADASGTTDYGEPYHWAEVEYRQREAEKIGYDLQELDKEYLQKLHKGE